MTLGNLVLAVSLWVFSPASPQTEPFGAYMSSSLPCIPYTAHNSSIAPSPS